MNIRRKSRSGIRPTSSGSGDKTPVRLPSPSGDTEPIRRRSSATAMERRLQRSCSSFNTCDTEESFSSSSNADEEVGLARTSSRNGRRAMMQRAQSVRGSIVAGRRHSDTKAKGVEENPKTNEEGTVTDSSAPKRGPRRFSDRPRGNGFRRASSMRALTTKETTSYATNQKLQW